MRTLFLGAALAAILAAGGATAADAPAAPPGAQRMGAWGFDLAGRDLAVAPGADFFTYANGPS